MEISPQLLALMQAYDNSHWEAIQNAQTIEDFAAIEEDFERIRRNIEYGSDEPKYIGNRREGVINPRWAEVNSPTGLKAQALIELGLRRPENNRYVGETYEG